MDAFPLLLLVGLYLGHRSWQVDFATRLQEAAVWNMVAFILESSVFALIGLQLRVVLRGLDDYEPGEAVLYAVVVLAAVIVSRFVWVYPATYLPILRSPSESRPPWTYPFVVSWAGMRGVVSLAVAFSIPVAVHGGERFPDRHLVLFLTFTTVIGTLLLQGLTLPPLIRRLGLPGRDVHQETLVEAQAQNEASVAAERRLDELLADPRNALPAPLENRLRTTLERRRNAVWERLGGVNEVTGESADDTYRRLTREVIVTEREVFVRLRDQGRIDDEMLRTLLHKLDLEEAAVYREEAE